MSMKNILTVFDGTAPSRPAVRLAILMAKRCDAHLTGLYARPLPSCAMPVDAYMPAEVIQTAIASDNDRAREVEDEFHDLCIAEGFDSRRQFLAEHGRPSALVAEFARTYDLVVMGQSTDGVWDADWAPHPDSVALQSGRPVLIAPAEFKGDLNDRVLVAWDGKRAASRALSDAMSILEDSADITVLHVGEDDAEVRKPGRDIMAHLSRHGVSADLKLSPRDRRSIGEMVLDACKETGAGLLVMGAYEHSRFSERLIGGVTKDVLKGAKTPVLISH
jgi:nucleotide-binding universal stress UspA family protein